MKKTNLFLTAVAFVSSLCAAEKTAQNPAQNPQAQAGTQNASNSANTQAGEQNASNSTNTQVGEQNASNSPNAQAGSQNLHVSQEQNQKAIIQPTSQNQKSVVKVIYPNLDKKQPKKITRYQHCIRYFSDCYMRALERSIGFCDENIVSDLSDQEAVDIAVVFSGLNKKDQKFTIFGDKTISSYGDLCNLIPFVIKQLEDMLPSHLQNK